MAQRFRVYSALAQDLSQFTMAMLGTSVTLNSNSMGSDALFLWLPWAPALTHIY